MQKAAAAAAAEVPTAMGGGPSPDAMQFREFMQSALQQQGGSLPQPVMIAITICLGALALVGIVGNILVVIFFYRGLRELPQNVYVIALAMLDTTVCAIVIPSTIYQDVWREATTDLMCKGFHILRCSLVTSSVFLLCLIAVDRFAIICFVPGIQTGRRKSVRMISLTLLMGFAVGTPLGLTTGTRRNVILRVVNEVRSVTVFHCTADYSILPLATVKIYKACLTLLFLCLLLAIVFFYANIFYFVRRRQSRWDKSRSYVSHASGCGGDGDGDGVKDDNGQAAKKVGSKNGGSGRRRGDGVRFEVRQDTAESSPAVLETDIDEVLGESAAASATAAAAVSASQTFDNSDDDSDVDDEPATTGVVNAGAATTATTPAEQRRMLGAQRRDDSVTGSRLAKAQRHLSERTRKRPHIKTAKVLSIITFFYLLSYLPFFLVFHLQETGGSSGSGGRSGSGGFRQVKFSAKNISATNISASSRYGDQSSFSIANLTESFGDRGNSSESLEWWQKISMGSGSGEGAGIGSLFKQTFYYFYFINHGVNPIIYGCMNTYFKQQICGMYNNIRLFCRGCGS